MDRAGQGAEASCTGARACPHPGRPHKCCMVREVLPRHYGILRSHSSASMSAAHLDIGIMTIISSLLGLTPSGSYIAHERDAP